MKSLYVREQKIYSLEKLLKIFECSDKTLSDIIVILEQYKLLQYEKKDQNKNLIIDTRIENIRNEESSRTSTNAKYVFTFVGIIILDNYVIKCLPKYLISSDKQTNDEKLLDMKQILKVILKYGKMKEETFNFFNGYSEDNSFSFISIILFLLNDYWENGLYVNSVSTIEINGDGNTIWERTVDETFPIISDGRPYYIDLINKCSVRSNDDYFHLLHKAVLTDCSRSLESAQLLDLFEIPPVKLSEGSMTDLGTPQYILERIKNELSVQFNTRKQMLLKAMYSYIDNKIKFYNFNKGISIFGTNSFNLIWEKACASVFNNMLTCRLKELPISIKDESPHHNRIIDYIEKPVWIDEKGNEYTTKSTLIPDIVTINKNNFYILDAKYYNIKWQKNGIVGQPGIESIVKQYFYQLAFKDFIQENELTNVKNVFLMPTEGEKIIKKGTVKLKLFDDSKLEDIEVILLPAKKIFDLYLKDETHDMEFLDKENVQF